jgi:hypothetical protein
VATVVLRITVVPQGDEKLDHDDVVKDLQLFLHEFPGYANDIPDVLGGFTVPVVEDVTEEVST